MRKPKLHSVKSWIHLFQAFNRGEKTHDIRIMDRDFQVGDLMELCEYDKFRENYTGRRAYGIITYITSGKHVACAFSPTCLAPDYAVLSLKKVMREEIQNEQWYEHPSTGREWPDLSPKEQYMQAKSEAWQAREEDYRSAGSPAERSFFDAEVSPILSKS